MPFKACHGFSESPRKAAVEVTLHVTRVEYHIEGQAFVFDPYAQDITREYMLGAPSDDFTEKRNTPISLSTTTSPTVWSNSPNRTSAGVWVWTQIPSPNGSKVL